MDALAFIHDDLCSVHGLLTPDSIVWSGDNLKLHNWPIHTLIGGGNILSSATILPLDMSYIAPEQAKYPKKQATCASDIWSAALTLLKILKPAIKLPDNPCRLAFYKDSKAVIDQIDGLIEVTDETLGLNNIDLWNEFMARALEPNPSKRATLHDLYAILSLTPKLKKQRSYELPELDQYNLQQPKILNLQLDEIYHLWRMSLGRNLESEQKQDDCPPVFKIPYLIVTDKQLCSKPDRQHSCHCIIDTRSRPLDLDKFKRDVSNIDPKILCPLILTKTPISNKRRSSVADDKRRLSTASETSLISREYSSKKSICESFTFADLDDLSQKSNNNNTIQLQANDNYKILPIVIKEADYAYQCGRMVLFKRLLAGCPYLKEQLVQEASIDIPPYFRAQTWAILLNVDRRKSELQYESIDKTTPVVTDRQISVDIPRCHQYNELMASPQGHEKLARILKTWLNYNSSQYVYWQGLDSLAAPFLLLNFDNEAMAFACFNAFVNKYLRGFFRKDNQVIVQQYLSMFTELLSYHDAPLASHLDKLGFLPNLYAIPWFLTMFTHVLPLHKVLHVWDCLILGDEKFPLCVGLALLTQLRQELLEFSFNDCIVAFSDLPEIDIERLIRDASHFYNSTPDRLITLTEIEPQTNARDW